MSRKFSAVATRHGVDVMDDLGFRWESFEAADPAAAPKAGAFAELAALAYAEGTGGAGSGPALRARTDGTGRPTWDLVTDGPALASFPRSRLGASPPAIARRMLAMALHAHALGVAEAEPDQAPAF